MIWSRSPITFVLAVLCIAPARDLAAQTVGSKAEYLKYIDPMLSIKDFGIQYVDDGAADASVLYPSDNKPRDPVLALVRLGVKGTPLLSGGLRTSPAPALLKN